MPGSIVEHRHRLYLRGASGVGGHGERAVVNDALLLGAGVVPPAAGRRVGAVDPDRMLRDVPPESCGEPEGCPSGSDGRGDVRDAVGGVVVAWAAEVGHGPRQGEPGRIVEGQPKRLGSHLDGARKAAVQIDGTDVVDADASRGECGPAGGREPLRAIEPWALRRQEHVVAARARPREDPSAPVHSGVPCDLRAGDDERCSLVDGQDAVHALGVRLGDEAVVGGDISDVVGGVRHGEPREVVVGGDRRHRRAEPPEPPALVCRVPLRPRGDGALEEGVQSGWRSEANG